MTFWIGLGIGVVLGALAVAGLALWVLSMLTMVEPDNRTWWEDEATPDGAGGGDDD